jgi:hypothetical protein
MRQGMFYRPSALLQNVEGTLNPFTHLVKQGVKLRRILLVLVVPFGSPDVDIVPGPDSLPILANEALVRPSLAIGREAIQDFIRGITFIGIGRNEVKGLRCAVQGGQHHQLVTVVLHAARRAVAVVS